MAHTHIEHATDAAEFISNEERTHWHDQALWFVRAKRDKAAGSVAEWEHLRELGCPDQAAHAVAIGGLPGAV